MKAGLRGAGGGRCCHTSLVGLEYREDPLLRPFITKHCVATCGGCEADGA